MFSAPQKGTVIIGEMKLKTVDAVYTISLSLRSSRRDTSICTYAYGMSEKVSMTRVMYDMA